MFFNNPVCTFHVAIYRNNYMEELTNNLVQQQKLRHSNAQGRVKTDLVANLLPVTEFYPEESLPHQHTHLLQQPPVPSPSLPRAPAGR